MADTSEDIQRDIDAINSISAVRFLLKIVCSNTGMGFAAIARVSDGTWTACRPMEIESSHLSKNDQPLERAAQAEILLVLELGKPLKGIRHGACVDDSAG